MPFIYHTDEDRREMLSFLGLSSEDELFRTIPSVLLMQNAPDVGSGKSEFALFEHFKAISQKNRPAGEGANFLGGGIYDHYIPAAVRHVAGRSEFYTAYTPYQPEVSQGTLQAIFEFQTLVSRMCSLPVANASMYDGATALAEAALMAVKTTGRTSVIYPENLNPRYLNVLKAYIQGGGIQLRPVPFTSGGTIDILALKEGLNEETAGVIVQNPNYFGLLEKPWKMAGDIKNNGSLLIASVDPVSLSIISPPGEYGADIAVGEGQSLGNDMNFGGPLLGFMACKQDFIRAMPGRIVSRTRDMDGKDAYVLVLQTREQHIRREKATSNICTNEGLMALRSTIYMSLLGENGFKQVGRICLDRSHRMLEIINSITGFKARFNGPFFREFVIECPMNAGTIIAKAGAEGVFAGIDLGRYFGPWAKNCMLTAVTEKATEAGMEKFFSVLAAIAGKSRTSK